MSRIPAAALLPLVAIPLAAGAGDPPAAEGDVTFEATVESSKLALGDDVVLRLAATNRTPKPVRVPELRLARDSVSVGVTWAPDAKATVTRLYGTWADDGSGLRLLPTATAVREIAPGETYRGSVTFAMVVAGDVTLAPVWGPEGPGRRTAKPLTLEVQPTGGAPKRLTVEVDTSQGAFQVELDGTVAFGAVSHFWSLARKGFYDGLTLHRVEPGLLVQGGSPRADGADGAGWYLPAEGEGHKLARGTFGLARGAHADTASSQFFAISDPGGKAATALTQEFTPLGRVVKGQEVVDALATVETDPRTGRPRAPLAVKEMRASVQ